ncbi:MAG: hypothetical protein JNL10_18910 [Verrucomicrobiales bacterium]|nr:hypothetical protein [Verrucomicrobiales bacterium]
MNSTAALLVLLAACSLPARAVVVAGRGAANRTVTVPLSPVTAADLDLPERDIRDVLSQLPATRSREDLTTARQYPPFSSLGSEAAVGERLDLLLKASLRSVEVLRNEDRSAASAVTHLLNSGRLGLAFGGVPGQDYEIRDDGSGRPETAGAWLYRIPSPRSGSKEILPHDPDGFRLAHTLGTVGSLITLPGYAGIPPSQPQEHAQWAHSIQLRGWTVRSNALDRLERTATTLAALLTRLELPEDSRGFARGIGRSLLNDTSLTPGGKQDRARELLANLYGDWIPKETIDLQARGFYRDTLSAYLANRLPSRNGYNEPFKKAGFFAVSLPSPGTERPFNTYIGGGATLVTPNTTPQVTYDNRIFRFTGRADGTRETETFAIPELGAISMAGADDNRLILGGPDATFQRFHFYGLVDANRDGRVEPESRRKLFSTDKFLGGAFLQWNPVSGIGTVLDRGTRDLHEFDGSDAAGFPTGIRFVGSLGNERTDAWRFQFSHDARWTLGYPEFAGSITRYSQHVESFFDDMLKRYEPLRLADSFGEFRPPPAPAGVVTPSSQALQFIGGADTEYRFQTQEPAGWTDRGSATTDPLGRGILDLSDVRTALKLGAYFRIASLDATESSPAFAITRDHTAPEVEHLRVRSGERLRLEYSAPPNGEVALWGGEALGTFEELETQETSSFGTGLFSDCLPEPNPFTFFWEIREQSPRVRTEMDYYSVPVGVRRTIYPGWNDRYYPGTQFRLDTPVGAAASLMVLITMNPQTSALLATAGTFGGMSLNYRLYQNAVFLAAQQTVVIPDLRRLLHPPVHVLPGGFFVVPVRCLVLGGKHYPMAQFRLAFPDHCPDAHWHGNVVFPLETPQAGIPDPDPNRCGFGSYEDIPQEEFPLLFQVWLEFRKQHLLSFLNVPPASTSDPNCGPVTAPE